MSGQDLPEPGALDEFKNQVRMWMELDGSIKQLQQLQRERRLYKKQLTDKILEFMARHNIDDLNSNNGRLIYKTSYVKTPLPQSVIRQRVETALNNETTLNPERSLTITSTVFNRDRTQRASLSLRKLQVS